MYLFITVHSMEGVQDPVFDRDRNIQVSSMIIFSVSGFTYARTVKVTRFMFVSVPDLF